MNRLALSMLPVLLLGVIASGPGCASPVSRPERNTAHWAQPVDLPGVPNLHRVTKGLFRSAQPTAEGMEALEGMGIKTIVNLRSFHSDRDEIQGTGLACEHLHMNAWHAEHEELVRFLKIAADGNRTPVLVHCQHGADRTGIACAAFRIAVCGWSKDEAIAEMTQGGFGFHPIWQNLVRYIEDLDVEALKRDAGLNGDG